MESVMTSNFSTNASTQSNSGWQQTACASEAVKAITTRFAKHAALITAGYSFTLDHAAQPASAIMFASISAACALSHTAIKDNVR